MYPKPHHPIESSVVVINVEVELRRTKPDYIAYKPTSDYDTGNEHFLVFDGPDGSLTTVWTQSTHENAGDHRIMFSSSDDNGVTWKSPKCIAGPPAGEEGPIASWGFPLVSKSGRIYVLYNQSQGVSDVSKAHTGTMDCVFSDDLGATWTSPETIPMRRSPHDSVDPTIPPNWVVWQMPSRDLQGRWFVGLTRWVSKDVRTKPHNTSWTAWESVSEFMRFTNIDEDPRPGDIHIEYSAWGEQSLRVPHYTNPLLSVAQEPSFVRLPDERLFCVMRTMAGCIWYSVSGDDGRTWSNPRPLLRRDHGKPILQPMFCCPIYELGDGRYILLHNNNDGRFDGCTPEETAKNRRPAYIALGEYRAGADQPVWFSESEFFADNDAVPLGPQGRLECIGYTSFTRRNGESVIWYPDRKYFLLGKKVTEEFLADLRVPNSE